jgi:hypothetical protein
MIAYGFLDHMSKYLLPTGDSDDKLQQLCNVLFFFSPLTPYQELKKNARQLCSCIPYQVRMQSVFRPPSHYFHNDCCYFVLHVVFRSSKCLSGLLDLAASFDISLLALKLGVRSEKKKCTVLMHPVTCPDNET